MPKLILIKHAAPQVKPFRRGDGLGEKPGEQTDFAVGIGFQPDPQGFQPRQQSQLGRIGAQAAFGHFGLINLGQGHSHTVVYQRLWAGGRRGRSLLQSKRDRGYGNLRLDPARGVLQSGHRIFHCAAAVFSRWQI